MTTPAKLGYRMPGEWVAHARCWMAWPCRAQLWHSGLAAAQRATAKIANAIAEFEPVTMMLRPEHREMAASLCAPEIELLDYALDDSWTRDTGPTFVVGRDGAVAGCDWRFNAWGEGGDSHAGDGALAEYILQLLDMPRFAAPFVLEGGAVHCDGDGTVLTTESVMLRGNRNPGMDRGAIEAALCDWLGARHVIWLPHGVAGDATHGHVDNVACFIRPGAVIALTCADAADPNQARLAANLDVLRAARDAAGRALDILTIDMPRRKAAGQQVLSYVNFYIANGGIVMPGFDDPADAAACETVRHAFPDRRVVQLPALDLCRGGGGIHCITQQQPAR